MYYDEQAELAWDLYQDNVAESLWTLRDLYKEFMEGSYKDNVLTCIKEMAFIVSELESWCSQGDEELEKHLATDKEDSLLMSNVKLIIKIASLLESE